MKYRLGFMAALAVTLAGCSAHNARPGPEAGTPPVNYRAAAIEAVRQNFFDPYSVRDASISAPFYSNAVFDGVSPFPRSGWVVCVRANSRNRMGGYVGLQPSLMLFEGEQVATVLSGPNYVGQVDNACAPAVYQAFPEVENL